MIIDALLNVIYTIFSVLTAPINIPDLPLEVSEVISTAVEYIGTGIGVLSNYVNLPYLLTLFGIVVAVEAGILIYKLVMFFLRKIPMLGVE